MNIPSGSNFNKMGRITISLGTHVPTLLIVTHCYHHWYGPNESRPDIMLILCVLWYRTGQGQNLSKLNGKDIKGKSLAPAWSWRIR